MLRVDGDAAAAIEAYARQLGVDQPEVRSDDGTSATVADLGLVPGGITQLRSVTDANGTWLLLAVSFG